MIKMEGRLLNLGSVDSCGRKFAEDCKITFPNKVPVYRNFNQSDPRFVIGNADILRDEKGLTCRVELTTDLLTEDEYYVASVMQRIPDEDEDGVRYKLYNIGNSRPESLLDFVEILETCLLEEGIIKKRGERELLPMQQGDVYQTYADVSALEEDFGIRLETSLKEGLSRYAKWYKEFYGDEKS